MKEDGKLTNFAAIELETFADDLLFGPLWIVVGIVFEECLLQWWREAVLETRKHIILGKFRRIEKKIL